ncbi:MAG: glycosyltransferase family 2 protein [Candidatus Lindowbacteria bacterium]|nr:glycosyltransferase family 2 protein [Candidatus Lindowbacteria bacterium]
MSVPQITIGITCFAEKDWVKECWKSVLNQTSDSWNAVIIVDGGGDEETLAVVKELEHPKLTKYIFEKNVGPYAARNKAFELTTCPFHFYLDGDDALPPDAVQNVLDQFAQHPEAAYIYGDYEVFGDVSRKMEMMVPQSDNDWAETQCAPGACAYSTKVWEDVGGFYTGWLAGGDGDYDYHLTLLDHGHQGIHCGKTIYRYRNHQNGRVSSQGLDKMYESYQTMITRHAPFFSTDWRQGTFLARGFETSLLSLIAQERFEDAKSLASHALNHRNLLSYISNGHVKRLALALTLLPVFTANAVGKIFGWWTGEHLIKRIPQIDRGKF